MAVGMCTFVFLAATVLISMIDAKMTERRTTLEAQSERFFNALKGNGATAKLVYLPLEAHGYRGRESVLDALAESYDWLDRYVKNRPAEAKTAGK